MMGTRNTGTKLAQSGSADEAGVKTYTDKARNAPPTESYLVALLCV